MQNITALMQTITPDYTQLLKETFDLEWGTERPGIHLSSLLKCPLQSYFKVEFGVAHNERTYGYFFDGAGIHMMLQKLFDKYHPDRFLIEDARNVDDMLVYTPDIIDTQTNRIIEFKTARSPVVTKEPRIDHIEQLKAYMAFSGISDGVVFYHLITKEQDNLFTQWNIHITKQEAEDIRKSILAKADLQKLAQKNRTPEILEKAADNPDKWWLCSGYCDYLDKCPAGQQAKQKMIQERTANAKSKTYFVKLSKDEIMALYELLNSSKLVKVSKALTSIWRLLAWKLGKTT